MAVTWKKLIYSDGSITGNAATATKLAATKTIGGVAFDGSANITVASATGGFTVTGALTATGDITAYYSDERLKDILGTIPDALDKVLSLNGYYFKENSIAKELGCDNDRLQVGLSAQEVERVLPEVITDSPIKNDQHYKALWYEKLIPLLVEAIKEQDKKINSLIEKVQELQK